MLIMTNHINMGKEEAKGAALILKYLASKTCLVFRICVRESASSAYLWLPHPAVSPGYLIGACLPLLLRCLRA